MKEKITATMAYIKRQIEWQEEELEADRAQVIRAAENSDAETIISRANTIDKAAILRLREAEGSRERNRQEFRVVNENGEEI